MANSNRFLYYVHDSYRSYDDFSSLIKKEVVEIGFVLFRYFYKIPKSENACFNTLLMLDGRMSWNTWGLKFIKNFPDFFI